MMMMMAIKIYSVAVRESTNRKKTQYYRATVLLCKFGFGFGFGFTGPAGLDEEAVDGVEGALGFHHSSSSSSSS